MKNLLKALVNFNTEVLPIVKGANNPFFKSKFADLATIQQTIKQPLSKNGLVITQANIWTDSQLFVETRIWHSESGENIASVFPVIVNKQAAQDYGSAVSYAKRYSLSGLMNLIIQDEDDDGEKAVGRNTPVQQPVQASNNYEDKKLYLLTLLEKTAYDDDTKDKLALKIDAMNTPAQFKKAEANLIANQIEDKDRIAMGLNYNQSDIKKTLK
jgi:hypothetical protein